MRKTILVLLVITIGLLTILPVAAQENDQPVVYALLMYSPTCPHCHELITNTLPPIQEEFGDSLVVLFVDVSSTSGHVLAQAVYETFNVPDEDHVVPMMVVDETVLIGGAEIPNRLPGIVRDGLKAGGIDLPPVPGLKEIYEASIAAQQESAQSGATPAPETTGEVVAANPTAVPTDTGLTGSSEDALDTFDSRSLSEKLAADPVANAMAVGVLIALVAAFVAVVWTGVRAISGKKSDLLDWLSGQITWLAAAITAGAALFVALTLTAKPDSDSLATPLAWAASAILLIVVLGILFQRVVMVDGGKKRVTLPGWLLPLMVVAGLIVAGYLAYVEANDVEAVCGAVGDCNTVQQSEYARLFGILSIGAFGILGYVAILGAWLLGKSKTLPLAKYSNIFLLGFALFGVLFSAYLTFLEPFVIGATCAWCLTSAILMLLTLWLVAGDGLRDLYAWRNGHL